MTGEMQRVLVIGCPGAGKSTFARKLHELTGLPLIYLDMLWHKPDRTNYPQAEFDNALTAVLETDRWIIDGNYQRTMEMRLKRCTTVFFLDYPLEVCLAGAEARIGTKRDDMPWVETEFDPEFRQWILDFSEDQIPRIHSLLLQYGDGRDIRWFRSRQEADDFLSALSAAQGLRG